MLSRVIPAARQSLSTATKTAVAASGNARSKYVLGAGLSAAAFAATSLATADGDGLHPPHYGWDHRWTNAFTGFDHFSLRRGYQVYKQVCSTCHSLNNIAYRHFVGVFLNEDEAKAIAAEVDVTDGPNDQGEMFERPGKLADYLPKPYANDEAARYSNNGAVPPDLALMVRAREGNEDYVFSLLTGYFEPPAGLKLREGLHYNAYFPGNAIAMAPPLHSDGQVEYDDGTPATVAQMAKDVTNFLSWAASPELDERKQLGIKIISLTVFMMFTTSYWNRLKWNLYKNAKLTYVDTVRTRSL